MIGEEEFERLKRLSSERDEAANRAAAALSTLVAKGVVTIPAAVKFAKEWDKAFGEVKAELALREARRAIRKARGTDGVPRGD
jgi:hypothetical protein